MRIFLAYLYRYLMIIAFIVFTLPRALALDLVQAYEQARQHDADYRAALVKLKGDLLVSDMSRSRYKPTITFTDRVARNRYESNQLDVANLDVSGCVDVACVISRVSQLNRNGTQSTYTSQQASLLLTQPIYDASLLAENDKAEAFVTQAKQNFLLAEQDLLLRISTAYFSVIKARSLLQSLEQQVDEVKKLNAIANKRQAMGLSKVQENYEAEVYKNSQALALLNAQSAYTIAELQLKNILGIESISEIQNLSNAMPITIEPARTIEEWQAVARKNNNGLQAAKALEQVSYYEIKARQGAHWPKLTFAASYMDEDYNGGRGFSPEAQTMAVGIEMKWPLYQGGGISIASKQAAYRLEEAKETSRAITQKLDAAIVATTMALSSDVAQYHMALTLQFSAEKVEQAEQRLSQQGAGSFLHYMNAQQQRLQAMQMVDKIRFDFIEHRLSLLRLTGELSLKHLQEINQWLQVDVVGSKETNANG